MDKDPYQELHDAMVNFGMACCEALGIVKLMDWLERVLRKYT